jgi:hypothetical protein
MFRVVPVRRLVLSTVSFVAIALTQSQAVGREFMPPEVARVTGAPCTPGPGEWCTLCHDGSPSKETARQPFVNNLKRYGFQIYDADGNPNPQDFDRALTEFEMDTSISDPGDTDGDGLSDREELARGLDPNPNGLPLCGGDAPPVVGYGCGARIAPAPPRFDRIALGAAVVVALGLVHARRKRRL